MLDKILQNIEKNIHDINNEYLTCIWREKCLFALKENSRFNKLLFWLKSEIEQCKSLIMVFNPASRTDDYLVNQYKLYKDKLGELGMLIQFYDLMCDKEINEIELYNIEYTICKIYGIKYDENMEDYICHTVDQE